MTLKAIFTSLLGLSLLAAAGCDETPQAREPVTTRPAGQAPAAEAPVGQAPVGQAPTAEAAKPPSDVTKIVHDYGRCYSDCFSEKAIATNRETCKLNCESLADAAREGLAGAPSKDVLMKTLAPLNGCVNACYEDKTLSDTNRETCLLTCRDVADVAAAPPPSAETN